ncbi:MAG TPA: DUF4352 domain-containing protein [Rubrobacteraceae bacterium]|nr:DUF4352 domain-containing protein [Rubrobacteraceae bacterium]
MSGSVRPRISRRSQETELTLDGVSGGVSRKSVKVSRALLYSALLVLVALAALGAYMATGVFTGKQDSSTYAMAQDIPTSFGVVAVEYVQKTPGLTAKQLGGMTHGIGSNIPPDKVQVQANVVLTNITNHTVDYSPEQFSMISGSGEKKIPLTSATLQGGTLQPDASISGMVSFVAPRDGSNLAIDFNDNDGKDIVIDLGRTDTTPSNALDGYHHHGADSHQGRDEGAKQDGRSPPSN